MNSRVFLLWTALVFMTLIVMLTTTKSENVLSDEWNLSKAYDTTTIDVVSGNILHVDLFQPGRIDDPGGVTLTVASQAETVLVRLGPVWLVKEKNLQIGKADSVIVIGSRVVFLGEPALIAARVVADGRTYVLRDLHGRPVDDSES